MKTFHEIRRKPIFKVIVLAVLAVFLVLALLTGMRYGSLELSCGKILHTLWYQPQGIEYQILWNIRLPRVLLGAMVGMSLALSGAILQGVMRNPLAAPGIIGVSPGGGLAAVLIMLVLPGLSLWLVPAAFCGAMLTAVLVYLLAWRGGVQPTRLILAGVAISSMFGAIISTILIFNADRVAGVLDFTIGSLSARSWPQVRAVWIYILAGSAAAMFLARRLNILTLGDEVAVGLGIRVEVLRFILLGISALLAAAAVSVAGLLGFVGLIAPHMVRLVIGSDFRFLLPGCALFGAGLVVCCDTIGRMVMQPTELPVGVIMALLGPPFFLYLLRRTRIHGN